MEELEEMKNKEFFNKFKEKLAKACEDIGGIFVEARKGAVCKIEYTTHGGNTRYGVKILLNNLDRIDNKPTINVLMTSHTENKKELHSMTVHNPEYGLGVPKSIESSKEKKEIKIETENGIKATISEERKPREHELFTFISKNNHEILRNMVVYRHPNW